MNRRQKIIVSVTGIFLVLLILVGLTYAYFLTQIEGNPNTKSISVTTANLALTYGDGTTALLTSSEPIIPGKFTASKDFTVTNNGNATVEDYGVVIEDFSIKYATTTDKVTKDDKTYMVYPSDMKITLTCTSDKGNTCTGITDGTLPTTNDILVTNTIEKDETQTYTLTLTYEDSGIDQSADMNKTIEGKINIIDTHSTVDLTGTVSNSEAGDYIQTNSTPRVSSIDKNGNYKIVGLEPGTHTVRLFSKTGEEKGSKEITIVKGETAGISGNTITITDTSRSFNIAIDATSESYTVGTEISDYSPFEKGTLAHNIYVSAASNKNGTQLRTQPLADFSGISEYWNGKYTYETKTTSSLCSGIDPWCIGETESEAKDCTNRPDSYEDAVNKYVYDECSLWTKYLDSYDATESKITFKHKEILPEKTLSMAEDDYGTSYYYRGAVQDNYVKFAGFNWRIVRINGDGSVRLILDGSLDKVVKDGETSAVYTNSALTALDSDGDIQFNSTNNDNAYVGYMFGSTGKTTYDATHKNTNSSTIKTYIDTFYEEYLSDYQSYLADSVFCGDKTLASTTIGSSNMATGFGTGSANKTYYAAAERLYYSTGETAITTAKPSLKCASSENATNTLTEEQRAYSRYTSKIDTSEFTTKKVLVNNDLTYPIALLSADELVMAGAWGKSSNQSYYLYDARANGNLGIYWWTMSPYYFGGSYANEFFSYADNSSYSLQNITVSGNFLDVRPVINLGTNVQVTGDGTSGNPYQIVTS